jgi:hypothetical protein
MSLIIFEYNGVTYKTHPKAVEFEYLMLPEEVMVKVEWEGTTPTLTPVERRPNKAYRGIAAFEHFEE